MLIILSIALIISCVWLARLIWFKPFSIHHFFERAYIEFLWEDPEALTQTGVLKPFGLAGHSSELTDLSPEATARMAEIGRKNLSVLERYDRSSLKDETAVSFDVFHWFLKSGVAGEPFLFHDYPVTHISGPHIEIPQFLSGAHRINNQSDIINYLNRLNKVNEKFGSLIDGLERRKKEGVIAPTFILQKAILFCDHFIEIQATENVLYTSFEKKLSKLETLENAERQKYLDDCQNILKTEVYPAYKRLSRYLLQLERSSLSIAGVWQLPNGNEFYKYCLLQHTGIEIEPEQLYELGKLEMNRLQGELSVLLNLLGYTTSDNPTSVLLSFGEVDSLTYNTENEADRMECLSQFETSINRVQPLISSYFNYVPQIELSVLEVPEYRALSSTVAFYIPPRGVPLSNGKMYVNTWRADKLTRYISATYAYHEGIPGHHLQKGIQAELTDLPTFRRFLPFTAYTEGWAMYAELLGHEMTGTEDPWDRIGALQSDLFRTVRMLTDIGIHHKMWLRDQAIRFMVENTGMSEEEVEVEVDRYIVWPGQGCAYKVGQLKFLELRRLAEKELAEDFDIKEFHDILIGQGAMPLEILEQRVKNYIAKKNEPA